LSKEERVHPFRFGVGTGVIESRDRWHELARRVEDLGFSTLCIPDHLGRASPFPALVSAAEATSRLRLGTLVVNNDFHRPLRLAQDVATTDMLTGGRLELGLGSGWSKPEYDLLGIAYDSPSVRAARLAEAIRVMQAAWTGEPRFSIGELDLPAVPEPAQRPHPPLLIGGNSDAVLRVAAAEADIVGLTGLAWRRGRLNPSAIGVDAIEERIAFVRKEAGDRFAELELNALSQVTEVTDDPEAALKPLAERFGVDPAIAAEGPFTLVGPVAALIEKLVALRERLGVSYWVVFEQAVDAFAPVVAALAGT
jgi:probable F420-dependent oxidoreductase